MWPATVTTSVRAASRPRHRHDLLSEAVDEVRAVEVPAEVEPDERHAAPLLDGDDLAEQDRGVLRQVVARLARRRRRRAARDGGRATPRRRRDRRPARPSRAGTPSPPPTLTSMMGCPAAIEPRRPPRPRPSAASKPASPSAEPARTGVEVDRVDRQVVPARRRPAPRRAGRARSRTSSAGAAVLEVRVVAGAGARDRCAGRSCVPARAGRSARSG